jgi:hypothetical protein
MLGNCLKREIRWIVWRWMDGGGGGGGAIVCLCPAEGNENGNLEEGGCPKE